MDALTPERAAEFRGLFFGEGHLDLCTNGLTSLTCRARIDVRDDDIAVLHWCQSLFGGSITRRPTMRSACWQITGRERIGALLDALEGGTLPSKKRQEVALVREAHGLLRGRGQALPTADEVARLFALRDELKALRAYRKAVN